MDKQLLDLLFIILQGDYLKNILHNYTIIGDHFINDFNDKLINSLLLFV